MKFKKKNFLNIVGYRGKQNKSSKNSTICQQQRHRFKNEKYSPWLLTI